MASPIPAFGRCDSCTPRSGTLSFRERDGVREHRVQGSPHPALSHSERVHVADGYGKINDPPVHAPISNAAARQVKGTASIMYGAQLPGR